MLKLFAVVAVAGTMVSTAAFADAIADRQARMKKNGEAAGVLVKTAKGEMAFDQATVTGALTTIRDDMTGLADLFPAGSETGGNTHASPKIWEDMDGFKAKIDALLTDVNAAIDQPPTSAAEVGPLLQTLGGDCQSCHEVYRLPMN